jgi:hypothetical protein
MIGKIPTWWENSVRGNRLTVGKNSAMVGNFPQWEKKSLPLHGSFSTAALALYAGIYLLLFYQCKAGSIRSDLYTADFVKYRSTFFVLIFCFKMDCVRRWIIFFITMKLKQCAM